jgi:hypothetical protein
MHLVLLLYLFCYTIITDVSATRDCLQGDCVTNTDTIVICQKSLRSLKIIYFLVWGVTLTPHSLLVPFVMKE